MLNEGDDFMAHSVGAWQPSTIIIVRKNAAATTIIVLVAIRIIIIIYLFGPEVHLNQRGQKSSDWSQYRLDTEHVSNLQSHAVREKIDYAIMKPCYNSSVLAPVCLTLSIQSLIQVKSSN